MSFFENLGNKISETVNSAGGKSKSTLRAGKLKGELRTLQAEREKLMITLGEGYFDARGCAEKLEPLNLICERIDALDGQVKNITAEIDRINGIIRCPVCNATVPSNSRFCPNCGAKIPEIAPEEPEKPEDSQEFCASCGAVREGGRFCSKCGKPFDASPEQKEPAAERPTVEINWPKPDDPSDGSIV